MVFYGIPWLVLDSDMDNGFFGGLALAMPMSNHGRNSTVAAAECVNPAKKSTAKPM